MLVIFTKPFIHGLFERWSVPTTLRGRGGYTHRGQLLVFTIPSLTPADLPDDNDSPHWPKGGSFIWATYHNSRTVFILVSFLFVWFQKQNKKPKAQNQHLIKSNIGKDLVSSQISSILPAKSQSWSHHIHSQ